MIQKKTYLQIQIFLDEKNIPEKIFWSSKDQNIYHHNCNSFMLFIWSNHKKETSRIELWTKNMPISNMNQFFYDIFIALSKAYKRATSNDALSKEILEFGYNFAKKVNLKK